MITDVLFKRYPDPWIGSERVPEKLALVLHQSAIVFLDDVAPTVPNHARLFGVPEKRLAREMGAFVLGKERSPEHRVVAMLGEHYDLWNDSHRSPDAFFKLRLSLVELLFREAEAIVSEFAPKKDSVAWLGVLSKRTSPLGSPVEVALAAIMNGVVELNARFQSADLPLQYHNGFIQCIDDPVTTAEIETPFWHLVAVPQLKNVDLDIKEAIDRRDSNKADAAFHAMRALESLIKILSDELGRTRGTERGASDYVDNLVSAKQGRFIETWEAEAIKLLFREVRNPLGHGPGSSSPLALTVHQTNWVIESCMSWIKSLWRRKT